MKSTESYKSKSAMSGGFKALAGSTLGLFVFFFPVPGEEATKIPLVIMIDGAKSWLGGNVNYLTLGIILLLCATWIAAQFVNNKRIRAYHKKDGVFSGVAFLLAAIFAFLLTFGIGPEWLLNDDVGGLSLYLGGSVLLTVTIAGLFVILLIEFGFLEFVGTLLEPLMRPVFRLPGKSAVDAVASFVAAPAVGIFVTNKLYESGQYTQREAASIATSFSICSLGFFALLASIGGIMDYLPHMILSSFIINFFLAAIMIRIPPLCNKLDIYYEGRMQTYEDMESNDKAHILSRACKAAAERASKTEKRDIYLGVWEAVTFAQKIVAFILSIATLSLLLATYTPVFDYLGLVVQPLIELMQLPNAAAIAPTVLVAIAEIALPVIIIAGEDVAPMAVFFVCTLSTVQIIFFTESANAMLESSIPLSITNLVLIFLIRTAIAIPLVAFVTHLIF
ncbi:Predicted histidine uptake transporter [Halomonas citrativorans]|uniref:Predicted histidine uptake transporter n=1 Tax=Halomonas citrativorans TaxID=2742612 RepID=A0A1R4HNL8_9GAMM|nr:nucleoside recognition domain-containing protein [Halomonas citrativorans]SJN08954.1 Predicted histidine uptake transporter [Halomonas citrativorans]